MKKNPQNYDLSSFCQLTLIRKTFMSVMILHAAVFRDNAVVSLVMMCLLLGLKHSRILLSAHAECHQSYGTQNTAQGICAP